MTKQNRHIDEKDFQRYLQNEMTDAERNAFERELQKYPFEAEALEGFQQISPEELSVDLKELNSKIKSNKNKTEYRYWAAAATILLLISSGILWFQLKDNSPTPELTENKTEIKEEKEEPAIEQELITEDKSLPENEIQEQTFRFNEESEDVASEIKIEPEQDEIQNLPDKNVGAISSRPVQIAETKKTGDTLEQTPAVPQNNTKVVIRGVASLKSQTEPGAIELPNKFGDLETLKNNEIKGKVISLGDRQPLPGATIQEIGTQNTTVADIHGNFTLKMKSDSNHQVVASFTGMETQEFQPKPDSANIISLTPDNVASGEVTIRGYGKPEESKIVNSTMKAEQNVRAWPESGMEEYEKYLEEKAILPVDYEQNRAVVKLLVNFNKFGRITGFTNKNQADSALFELAKKIIEEGPEWSPEIRNKRPVNAEKELKIVFRKRK